MKALVTGGCGFIGSNLVRELVRQGHRVDVLDDLSSGDIANLEGLKIRNLMGLLVPQYEESHENARENETVLVIQGDIEDSHTLSRIKRGYYDVIYHLAANPRVEYSIHNPAATTDVNCTRSLTLFETVRDSGSKTRIVFASSAAVYGDPVEIPTSESCDLNPLSPYGIQKMYVEQYSKVASEIHGIDVVCLRYFNVYGPGQGGDSPYATAISAWCNAIHSGKPLRSDGDGEQSRDMIFVGDIVRANILAGIRKEKFRGEVINIGTGTTHTNNEILTMFRARFPNIEVTHAPRRQGDVRKTLSNPGLAGKLLGFEAAVDIQSGLEQTWKWWGI
jgi:nucleoside-diphosphate-sugar epimerase